MQRPRRKRPTVRHARTAGMYPQIDNIVERQQRLEKLRKLEEKKRMTSSLGRAFKRFFQRRDEEQKRRRTV